MPVESVNPTLGWNLARDVGEVLEYHFMVNALLAGSIVAVMAGLMGWLMVLRRQAFAGHTLSMMAFPGASGASLLGIPAAWGYFALCGAGALAIGRFSDRGSGSLPEQGARIGAVQATALALGFLFVSLYGGVLGDLESLLFGNILAISDVQVLVLAAVALAVLATLAVLARPLLFASVDPDVASARGVRVSLLSGGFLLLLAVAVAATSQITGPLLVFALLVAPAATAQLITARPAASLALSVLLGLLIVWLGMGIAYFSIYPAGFFISTVAFTAYLLVRLCVGMRERRGSARAPAAQPPQRRSRDALS
jgi:zinc/manganese transport system permease protein